MKIANLDFPDKCPKSCFEKQGPFYQGCLCSRCPVFNCPVLLDPDNYEYDWAIQFYNYINGGKEPTL